VLIPLVVGLVVFFSMGGASQGSDPTIILQLEEHRPTPVPEPGTGLLLGTGLVVLFALIPRVRRRAGPLAKR
jgi:hypothetical protein